VGPKLQIMQMSYTVYYYVLGAEKLIAILEGMPLLQCMPRCTGLRIIAGTNVLHIRNWQTLCEMTSWPQSRTHDVISHIRQSILPNLIPILIGFDTTESLGVLRGRPNNKNNNNNNHY